jgi:hypothetical protein
MSNTTIPNVVRDVLRSLSYAEESNQRWYYNGMYRDLMDLYPKCDLKTQRYIIGEVPTMREAMRYHV